MEKKTILLMCAAACAAVLIGACVSERRGIDAGLGGPGGHGGPGGPGGPGGREERGASMAGPAGAASEASMALMQLRSLVAAAESEPELALSDTQVSAILPILSEWRSELSAKTKAKADVYAKKIAALLTEKQKAYRPEPPRDRMSGGPGRGGQPADGLRDGPPGGPGGSDALEALDELLRVLGAA